MDLVFQLNNGDRVSYLRNLMHSLGCSYVCLWTYSPDINILYCEEGHFQEEVATQVPSSSSGATLVRKFFDDYRQSVFSVGNDLVPGLAFRNRNPYLELQELDLQRLASVELQRHFYLEARIKMAVFLGCARGEIELGMSYIPQNLEISMQNLFPQDFARFQSSQAIEVQRLADQSRSLSSSSPQSMDSNEYPPFLYTVTSTPTYIQEPIRGSPLIMEQTTAKAQSTPMGVLSQLQNIPFPTPESTDATLTRAYLAILYSTASSSRSTQPSVTGGQQSSSSYGSQVSRRPSAFKSYHQVGLGPSGVIQMRSNLRRQTMLKRAIAYYRGLNYRRIQEHGSVQGSRPTSTQLHHMISERKRREKINESFLALRSLLPQGTKKDKASVLKTTKEYLSSLKTQLSELSKRNQLLEAELSTKKETTASQVDIITTNERLIVRVTPVSESTSGERMVDLQVRLRGDTPVTDLLIRLLDFLKRIREASLVSMEAQNHREIAEADQSPSNLVTFRLRIEESEWDEVAFEEAVRRILADLGQ